MTQQINVHGIAIKPGISKNRIKYTKEELINFTPTLKNKPILKDHFSAVDNTVGLVENTEYDDRVNVHYEGWVKEDGKGLIEKIQDKRIKEVSIGAFVKQLVRENPDDDYLLAVGLEGMELSLTPTPAVKGTSLSQTLDLMQQHKTDEKVKIIPVLENTNLFENADNFQQIINKEEVKMAEEQKEKLPVENIQQEVKEEKRVLDSTVKINVDTSLVDEAIQKTEKLLALKEKLKEMNVVERSNIVEPEKPAMEEKVDNTKAKVTKEEIKETLEATEGKTVIERAEFGNGFSYWMHPKADGRMI